MNEKAHIEQVRKGIENLISVIEGKVDFKAQSGKTKTKAILNARKKAFLTAASMIIKLNLKENAVYNGRVNSKWYIDILDKVIGKGGNAIDILFDGIEAQIEYDTDDELVTEITARGAAFDDTEQMMSELKAMRLLLDRNKDSKDDTFTVEKTSTNYCVKNAD